MSNPAKVIKRECETLEWLRKKAARGNTPWGFCNAIENALRRSNESVGVHVLLQWSVVHIPTGDRIWIHVGGQIEVLNDAMGQVTYSLCVANNPENGEKRRVLRKYHFDYASPSLCRRNAHPIFHLQYPGRLTADLRKVLEDSHQDPSFDEPRVFYTPVSLAMVLHMAFREFPDDLTRRLAADSYWRRLLKRDQKKLLAPFYKKCLVLIGDDKIVMDAAYDS